MDGYIRSIDLVINALQGLAIISTKENMDRLLGSIQTLEKMQQEMRESSSSTPELKVVNAE